MPVSIQELFPPSVRTGRTNFILEHPDGSRFRTQIYATLEGEAAAMRRLPGAPPPFHSLNLPASLQTLSSLRHGLILLCGPTGSGKSTTLATLAQLALQTRGGMMITLEDPIEYIYSKPVQGGHVRQRELGAHMPTFASGLRDALRADPDLIVVGEMRDPETIQLALTAAETGHLVFSTLHAPSSAAAMERIVACYPPESQASIRSQLAQAIQAVVVQRLIPRDIGSGRVPAVEILRATYGIRAMIREGKTAQVHSALHTHAEQGCITLEKSLAALVASRTISLDQARSAANDPKALSVLL